MRNDLTTTLSTLNLLVAQACNLCQPRGGIRCMEAKDNLKRNLSQSVSPEAENLRLKATQRTKGSYYEKDN